MVVFRVGIGCFLGGDADAGGLDDPEGCTPGLGEDASVEGLGDPY